MSTAWIAEIIDAVGRLVPASRGAGSSPKPLAEARQVDEGRYVVSTARGPIRTESHNGLHLARRDDTGPDRQRYQVSDVEEGQSELRVTVAPHAPETGLWLWGTPRPAGQLERTLVEAWRRLDDPGLAARIVEGQLSPTPAIVPYGPAGLSDSQRAAYLACTTPGVRVVWGPPGTGKTTVLARAIDDLVSRRQRVLLVSSTNIAVDNALAAAARRRNPAVGELVRVGPPALAEVAGDDRVALPRLVEAKAAALVAERDQVGREIKELAARPELVRLREIEKRLVGFDPDAYEQARVRVERDRALTELSGQLHAAEARCLSVGRTRQERHRIWRDALQRRGAVEPARVELTAAEELRSEIRRLESIATTAEGEVLAAEIRLETATREHDAASGGSPKARWRERGRRSELAKALAAATKYLSAAREKRDEARRLAERGRELNTPRIEAHERAAAPVTAADLARLDHAVGAAQAGAGAADEALRAAEHDRAAIQAARETKLREPGANADERAAVAAADRAGHPALAAERAELADVTRELTGRRRMLEDRYEHLLTEIEKARTGAEPDIIGHASLVATTLSRFRLNRHVYQGQYDAVFIDEAGAASLPELLLAAANGGQTVVLLGDFCQLGPVFQPDRSIELTASMRKWLDERSCFDLLGIMEPRDALGRPGVVTLRETRRFGADVVELVNRIAYGGVLVSAPDGGRPADDDHPPIVLVDVDGLDTLSRARVPASGKGQWWLAGGLLSRALAEYHRERDESTGIVAPYRAESLAIIEHLDDVGSLGGSPAIEAGTVHSFQGREFDVVVVDTVEDGDSAGWCSRAAMRPGATRDHRGGARLVNVAVTRARHRVYLLASGRAIASARAGTTFCHIQALVDAGTIRVVRAADLLGLPAHEVDRAQLNPVAAELWAAFDGHVVSDGVFDEFGYIQALTAEIDAARHSIWMWAPWFGPRQDEVLPALERATARGVTITVFVVGDSDSVVRSQRARDARPPVADRARRPSVEERLAALRAAVTQVVRIAQMHQKIVVIDEETMFLGSYNTLSSQNRREIMVRHRGRRFSQKILEHERAAALARPPLCPDHHRQMEARRSQAHSRGYPWGWACPERGCGQRLPLPEPNARAGSRSGWSRTSGARTGG